MEPTGPEAGWSTHEDPSFWPWLTDDALSPSQTHESLSNSLRSTSNQRNSGSNVASNSSVKNDDTFVLCHLFQKEEFDDIKEDKIYTSVSSSHITAKSSYADNLDPLDLNADPPDLPKEVLLQFDELSVIKSDQREWFFFCRTDAELDLHLLNLDQKDEKAYMEPTGPEAGWSTHEDPSFWPWLTHVALSPSQTHESLSHSLRSTSNQLNSGSNVASNSSVKNDANLFPPEAKQLDTFVLCHLFQKEEFDDIKEDKIYTSVSSSHITAKSSYADNLDPLDLNADPPDLPKEIFYGNLLQRKGIEKRITSESQGMVFEVEALEMKSSSGEKIEEIGVEFEASRQDKKFEIEEIGIEPETSYIDRKTFSIVQCEAHQSCLMWGGLGLTETPKEEYWKNAKKIYLMDNELSVLPKNPRCPVLSTLLLQRNYKLRTIPPSFFDYMPALQLLNLSRTGIKSLPESILRLVSLKRLFLNDCHCFMILSPKVGKLKQLEVLDLEGTNIMDLPNEIKKLTNLTCLKVSLYACMSNGRRAMQSDVVVACGIISALSHLEELMINVNPDDKRWNACVEAIVSEVEVIIDATDAHEEDSEENAHEEDNEADAHEEDDDADAHEISLHYMPGLVSISSGLHIAPRLEWLSFYNCPNLKHLLIEEVYSKYLKKIKGEWNWWVALKWRSGRPSYLDDIFIPINI
ncbi:hypothetical protein FH972_022283 [Carpinus fangiana]|uniref:Disease resistance R13L4/SHOC-2-like LRR domain-containing protein n=1 Tax=Carpinus fangiana TaxID=176857 RepID=A0A5N6KS51_9ROSI|nr:hypothetical protein FH972_022283 [Carpinus fangiana]